MRIEPGLLTLDIRCVHEFSISAIRRGARLARYRPSSNAFSTHPPRRIPPIDRSGGSNSGGSALGQVGIFECWIWVTRGMAGKPGRLKKTKRRSSAAERANRLPAFGNWRRRLFVVYCVAVMWYHRRCSAKMSPGGLLDAEQHLRLDSG